VNPNRRPAPSNRKYRFIVQEVMDLAGEDHIWQQQEVTVWGTQGERLIREIGVVARMQEYEREEK
jgi:hypothetical protein